MGRLYKGPIFRNIKSLLAFLFLLDFLDGCQISF